MTKLKSLSHLFGFVPAAKQATTSADHSAVIADIDWAIEVRSRELAEMESRRGEAILDGADPDKFHADLRTLQEAIKTLRDTRETAIIRRDEAATREARAVLEQQAGTVREIDLPAYENALRRYHKHLVDIAEDAALIEAHGRAIADTDAELRRSDRPDLALDVERIRQQVIEELATPPDLGAPPEIGPLPERPKLERRPNESAENLKRRTDEAHAHLITRHKAAFDLRAQNYSAQRDAAARREDPLRVAGERAIYAIEAVSFPMDAHEAARNRRRVRVESFLDRSTGQAIRKVQATDGRGAPQADPRIEERRAANAAAFKDPA